MYPNTPYGPYIGQPPHNNNTAITTNVYLNGNGNAVQPHLQSPTTPYPAPPPPHYSSYSHFPMLPQQQLGGGPGILEQSQIPTHTSQPEYGSGLTNVKSDGEDKGTVNPQRTRPISVVFGSISVDTSSPNTTAVPEENHTNNREGDDTTSGDKEKPSTVFSIGVRPGEEPSPSRLRSRTRSSQARSRMPTGTDTWLMTDLTNSEIPGEHQKRSDRNGREDGVKDDAEDKDTTDGTTRGGVVDLTDPAVQTQTQTQTKWEFGTASRPAAEVGGENVSVPVELARVGLDASRPIYVPLSMGMAGPVTNIGLPLVPPTVPGGGAPINGTAEMNSNEFEVQDFGFGFGVVRGGAYPPMMARDQRREHVGERDQEAMFDRQMGLERERQRDLEIESLRESQRLRDLEFNSGLGRSKRGSYGGGYERGDGFDRGGFGGRRGRGFGRGFNRGYRGGGYQPLQRPPPPQSFQPLAPPPSETVYYPPSPLTTYIPTGYESYQPPPLPSPPQSIPVTPASAPVPVPLSTLSFPLDPTRYYLLGQLEYYLSSQNMAQDFFLRQRVSSFFFVSYYINVDHCYVIDGLQRMDTNIINRVFQ